MKATQAERAGVPPAIQLKPTETRQQCFERHFSRCMMKAGDRCVFKRPKRNKIYGHIDHIEEDIGKMYWTQGGEVPRYIRVRIDTVDKTTGEITESLHVWTTESKICYVPPVTEPKA